MAFAPGAAMKDLGNAEKQEVRRWANNRPETATFIPKTRACHAHMRRMKTLQKFAPAHANVHNHFNPERHLVDRPTYKGRRTAAPAGWQLAS